MFEALTERMDATDVDKKALLVGKLEGAAQAWLMGSSGTWVNWSFLELKGAMLSYFGEESRTNARKLEQYK